MAADPNPQAELTRLERGLSDGLGPAYALRGVERWHLERALSLVRERARAAGLELCAHDAADAAFSSAALLDDLCGNAMFAEARCILLAASGDGLKKVGATDSPVARGVRSFLEGRRGTLLIAGGSLRADAALVKLVKKAGGDLFSFRALWDTPPPWDPDPAKTELVQWIQSRARELELGLPVEAAVLLAKAKGNDLGALDAELERLLRAGPEAVRELSSDGAGSPMRLADLLTDGDVRAALFEIERLYRSGFQKSRGGGREMASGAILAVLFGSLRRGVRQGLVGAAAVAAGADPKSAADEAGVPTWPKARQAFQARLDSRRPREWRDMYVDLMALERRSRSGASVDAGDLAAFALRWRRRRAPARSRGTRAAAGAAR